MKLYALQIGRNPELSSAEITAVLGSNKIIERNPDTIILELEQLDQTSAQTLQDKLGGTIKIAEIFCKMPNKSPATKIHNKIAANIIKQISDKKRLNFAISIFGYKKSQTTNIKETLNFLKKFFKDSKIKSYFLNKGSKNIKPSTIFQAKLIKKGLDLNIIYGEKHIYLSKTLAIQNISKYTIRDFKKPHRDARNGMLPPKLSQIMINLAEPAQTIYDPFCGSGTIAMEGALMDKTVLGSDLNPEMVEHSDKNLYWLSRKFEKQAKYRFFTEDAQFMNKKNIQSEIDAIVTEGYLGPPLESPPTSQQREKNFRNLANLHLNWLTSANKILKKGQKIVTCVTAYQDKGQTHHLPKFHQIAELAGYKINKQLLYSRPDQVVARDIYVLEKL